MALDGWRYSSLRILGEGTHGEASFFGFNDSRTEAAMMAEILSSHFINFWFLTTALLCGVSLSLFFYYHTIEIEQQQQTSSSQKLVDIVPTSLTSRHDANSEAAEESGSVTGEPSGATKKKTRRSRRGGYRRKRQQQKKIEALLLQQNTSVVDISKSKPSLCDNSTATTESESEPSSCDSSAASDSENHQTTSSDNSDNQTSNSSAISITQYVHVPALETPTRCYQYSTCNSNDGREYWNDTSSDSSVSETSQSEPSIQSTSDGSQTTIGSPPPVVEAFSMWGPMQLSQLQQSRYVALDCEMVGVGPEGRYSALARVTIIDWDGKVLMDEFVKPGQRVTDYRTFVSGITPEILDKATLNFFTCRKRVMKLLRGKILVGHALMNDLNVLKISHPWFMTRDTAMHEPFMKVRFLDGALWPRSLKDLARDLLNRDVQVYGRPHCSYEDALAALDLYRLVWQPWEQSMEYIIRNRAWAIQQQQKRQQRKLTARNY